MATSFMKDIEKFSNDINALIKNPIIAKSTPDLAMIRNIKIVITSLLDSVHDCSGGSNLMEIYVRNTIDNLIKIVESAPTVPTVPAAAAAAAAQGVALAAPVAPAAQSVAITTITKNELIRLLKTKNIVKLITSTFSEDFAGLLLEVPSVEYKKYSYAKGYSHASFFSGIHPLLSRRHLGLIYDKLYKHDISDGFVTSLKSNLAMPYITALQGTTHFHNFITIRDNGFKHKMFTLQDSFAFPKKCTDTIYTGPGLWDNGGKNQNVDDKNGKKVLALSYGEAQSISKYDNGMEAQQLRLPNGNPKKPPNITSIPSNYVFTLDNIFDLQTKPSSAIIKGGEHVIHYRWKNGYGTTKRHKEGGILGIQSIKTEDNNLYPSSTSPATGVTLTHRYYDNTQGTQGTQGNIRTHEVKLTYKELLKINKDQVKKLLVSLFKSTSNYDKTTIQSIDKFFTQFFVDKKTSPQFKLSDIFAGQYRIQNKYIFIGSLLDLKRSGDFGQSASVKDIGNTLNRKGIFLTNDRIAAYISTMIHKNWTMLSSSEYEDLRLTAVWNTTNRVSPKKIPPSHNVDPRDFPTFKRKNIIVGGINKNKLKKKYIGGVLDAKIQENLLNYYRKASVIYEKKEDIYNFIISYLKYYFFKKLIKNPSTYQQSDMEEDKPWVDADIDYVDTGADAGADADAATSRKKDTDEYIFKLLPDKGETDGDYKKFLFSIYIIYLLDEGSFYDYFEKFDKMKKGKVSNDNLNELTFYENILEEINKLEEIIFEKGLVISKLERYDIFHSLLCNKRLSGDNIIINKIKGIIDVPILPSASIMHKDSRARSKTIRQTRSIINKIKGIIDVPILPSASIMHKDSRARSKTIRQTRSQTGRRTRSKSRSKSRSISRRQSIRKERGVSSKPLEEQQRLGGGGKKKRVKKRVAEQVSGSDSEKDGSGSDSEKRDGSSRRRKVPVEEQESEAARVQEEERKREAAIAQEEKQDKREAAIVKRKARQKKKAARVKEKEEEREKREAERVKEEERRKQNLLHFNVCNALRTFLRKKVSSDDSDYDDDDSDDSDDAKDDDGVDDDAVKDDDGVEDDDAKDKKEDEEAATASSSAFLAAAAVKKKEEDGDDVEDDDGDDDDYCKIYDAYLIEKRYENIIKVLARMLIHKTIPPRDILEENDPYILSINGYIAKCINIVIFMMTELKIDAEIAWDIIYRFIIDLDLDFSKLNTGDYLDKAFKAKPDFIYKTPFAYYDKVFIYETALNIEKYAKYDEDIKKYIEEILKLSCAEALKKTIKPEIKQFRQEIVLLMLSCINKLIKLPKDDDLYKKIKELMLKIKNMKDIKKAEIIMSIIQDIFINDNDKGNDIDSLIKIVDFYELQGNNSDQDYFDIVKIMIELLKGYTGDIIDIIDIYKLAKGINKFKEKKENKDIYIEAVIPFICILLNRDGASIKSDDIKKIIDDAVANYVQIKTQEAAEAAEAAEAGVEMDTETDEADAEAVKEVRVQHLLNIYFSKNNFIHLMRGGGVYDPALKGGKYKKQHYYDYKIKRYLEKIIKIKDSIKILRKNNDKNKIIKQQELIKELKEKIKKESKLLKNNKGKCVASNDRNARKVNQSSVKARKDNSPVVKAKKDNIPSVKAKKDNSPVLKTKKDNSPTVKAKKDNSPLVKAKKDNSPVLKTKKDNSPQVKAKKDNSPILKTKNDNSPLVKAKKDNSPAVKAKKDNSPAVKAKKDNSPVLKTKNDNSPLVKAKKDNSPVLKTKKDNSPVLKTKKDNSSVVKAKKDNSPPVKAKKDNSPLVKAKKEGDKYKMEELKDIAKKHNIKITKKVQDKYVYMNKSELTSILLKNEVI